MNSSINELENILTKGDLEKNNNSLLNKKLDLYNEEKKSLESAIKNDNLLLGYMNKYKEDSLNNMLNTKSRISEINNTEFQNKKDMVNNLINIIYFILYSIGLGLALISGLITLRMLSIAFVLGLLTLLFSFLFSSSFWKRYGDISMSISKGTVRGIINKTGPVKTCPSECVVRK